MSLLDIRGMDVAFGTGAAPAVAGFALSLTAGEVVGIVGESGSGKSSAMLALLGLLDDAAQVRAERLAFDGRELGVRGAAGTPGLLGREIGVVFQDAAAALGPCHTIGSQIEETLAANTRDPRRQRRRRAIGLLERVGVAADRCDAYPHELSGGMQQRALIAVAIACRPRLLIADEPTTALDVTLQAAILDLLRGLQRDLGMGLILVSHDLAVVASMATRALVMRAGRVVDAGALPGLFLQPGHDYTRALVAAMPENRAPRWRAEAVR